MGESSGQPPWQWLAHDEFVLERGQSAEGDLPPTSVLGAFDPGHAVRSVLTGVPDAKFEDVRLQKALEGLHGGVCHQRPPTRHNRPATPLPLSQWTPFWKDAATRVGWSCSTAPHRNANGSAPARRGKSAASRPRESRTLVKDWHPKPCADRFTRQGRFVPRGTGTPRPSSFPLELLLGAEDRIPIPDRRRSPIWTESWTDGLKWLLPTNVRAARSLWSSIVMQAPPARGHPRSPRWGRLRSPGLTHRLPRRGNRQLNAAIHVAAVTQARDPGPGRDHYRRKLAEHKTIKEARRSRKRRISNAIYRRILADHEGAQPAAA